MLAKPPVSGDGYWFWPPMAQAEKRMPEPVLVVGFSYSYGYAPDSYVPCVFVYPTSGYVKIPSNVNTRWLYTSLSEIILETIGAL